LSSVTTRGQNLAPSVRLLDPQAEDLLAAIDAHAERDVDGLVAHRAFVADLDPQGIEEHQRVERFQRPVLPLGDLVQHRVGDRADQLGRDVDAAELGQGPLALPDRHAPGVHRHDLVVEARQPPAVLGDQLRIEGREAIARHRDAQLAAVGEQRLLAVAVAAVGPALGRLAVEMVVHLGVQRPLRQRTFQLVDEAILAEGSLRITAGQELIQQLVRDHRRFASCHARVPSFPAS
jgi:hypothetical protein